MNWPDYEVMGGQQRLNAIKEFLTNGFVLRGLQIIPTLNGRRGQSSWCDERRLAEAPTHHPELFVRRSSAGAITIH